LYLTSNFIIKIQNYICFLKDPHIKELVGVLYLVTNQSLGNGNG